MPSVKDLLAHPDAVTERELASHHAAPFDSEALYLRSLAKYRGEAAPPKAAPGITSRAGFRSMMAAACLLVTLGLAGGIWARQQRITPIPPENPTQFASVAATDEASTGASAETESLEALILPDTDAPTQAPDPTEAPTGAPAPTEPPTQVPDPTDPAEPTRAPQPVMPTERTISTDAPTEQATEPYSPVTKEEKEQPQSVTEAEEVIVPEPTDEPTEPPADADSPPPDLPPVYPTEYSGFRISKPDAGSWDLSCLVWMDGVAPSPEGYLRYESMDDDITITRSSSHDFSLEEEEPVFDVTYAGRSFKLWQHRRTSFTAYLRTENYDILYGYGVPAIAVYSGPELLLWDDGYYSFTLRSDGIGDMNTMEYIMKNLIQNPDGERIEV